MIYSGGAFLIEWESISQICQTHTRLEPGLESEMGNTSSRSMRSAFTFAAGLLLLCFLCAPPFSSADEPSPVELEKIDSSAIINRDMAVLEDPKGVLTPEEIISPAVQERFTLNKEGRPNKE